MKSQTRRILLPYSIVILFAYIGFSLPLPILPEMFLDPERSILAGSLLRTKMIYLGLVMASFPFGQFLGAPLLGRLSDQYGRKKIILLSLTGTMIGYCITALAVQVSSIWGMFAGLAVCGFCEGNVTIAQSVVADLNDKEEQQSEKAVQFGWINIFISLGFIIGPLMGGQLADSAVVSWFTFATPFWAGAIMTLLGIGVIYWKSQETLKRKPDKSWRLLNSMWSGLKRPKLKGFYVVNFFLALSYFAFFRFFPVFLERRFNFSPSQLSFVMVYEALAIAAAVAWFIPFLSRRFTSMQCLCLFSLLLALSFMICTLPGSAYALFLTVPPMGFCLGVVITNGSLLISNSASHLFQGQAMGTLTSVQVLAEIFTGLAGGPLAALTTTLPLYIGAAMAVVASMILWNMMRLEKTSINKT